MGTYSIGEALNLLMERSNWKPVIYELRLKEDWPSIVGEMIAKYTRNVLLVEKTLIIYTDVAALKQELLYSKDELIKTINNHFKELIVNDIQIK
jgi:predicted nucleic acid-binding Zn ribbon protein